MALASSSLSNKGMIPALRIVTAVNTPKDGWVVLPAEGTPIEAIQPSAANEAVSSLIASGGNFWSHLGQARSDESDITWFIGGTPPNWQAAPLAVAIVLENKDPKGAQEIGQELLTDAMNH